MWKWDFVYKIFPVIFSAIRVTIEATLVSFIVAAVLGLMFALARRSRVRPLRWVVIGIVDFIRSTPLLVQLFFLYAALPSIGIVLSPFVAGVVGLGLHYSTYLSEVYRSGIEAVPKGQWEASKALNFNRFQTWSSIILPQAIPPIIPVMGNYLILMFKETPLLLAVSLVEMLTTADDIVSQTFRPVEPYTIVGFLFLLLSYPSSLFVQFIEKRLNKNTRT